MANPVTHILIPMFIIETYRRYFAKKKFSRWWVFVAGFIGGAPDFDLIFSWLMNGYYDLDYHRTITHTLLIPIILTIVGVCIYQMHSQKKLRKAYWKTIYTALFIMSISVAAHVMLDAIDGLTQWFYPLSWSIELPNLILTPYRAAMIDGALLLAWILYQEELFNDILRFLRIKH
jgi:membrane-bound metal-dependent hydrolase YbcI (DUF457 family)